MQSYTNDYLISEGVGPTMLLLRCLEVYIGLLRLHVLIYQIYFLNLNKYKFL